jgi:hypothetical protein
MTVFDEGFPGVIARAGAPKHPPIISQKKTLTNHPHHDF